jgi:hypothetical protein
VDRFSLNVWRDLAQRQDLPPSAVPSVLAALTRPVERGLHPGHEYAVRDQSEALGKALPNLLARTTDPKVRRSLIAAAGRADVETALNKGVLTYQDLDAITAAHGVWSSLVAMAAQEPGRLDVAVGLLPRLPRHELTGVLWSWHSDQAVPEPIVDALCALVLAPVAAVLADPGTALREDLPLNFQVANWPEEGSGAAKQVLDRIPDHWERILADPDLRPAAAHILLDLGKKLPEPVLRACAPYACATELTGRVPKPTVVARERLGKIAHRVHSHPALLDLVGAELGAAAHSCVSKGRLLTAPRSGFEAGDLSRLVCDLAPLSTSRDHLQRALTAVMALPAPKVVLHQPRISMSGEEVTDSLRHRLSSSYQDGRVKALAALAGNPVADREHLAAALAQLEPSELEWLTKSTDTPEWYVQAAAAVLPPPEEQDVRRILDDDELDDHPDPQGQLASWLQLADELLDSDDYRIYNHVLGSRHLTDQLLRQIPLRQVLQASPQVRDVVILRVCGEDPARWAAFEAATEQRSIERDYQAANIPFGTVLDELDAAAGAAGHVQGPA